MNIQRYFDKTAVLHTKHLFFQQVGTFTFRTSNPPVKNRVCVKSVSHSVSRGLRLETQISKGKLGSICPTVEDDVFQGRVVYNQIININEMNRDFGFIKSIENCETANRKKNLKGVYSLGRASSPSGM